MKVIKPVTITDAMLISSGAAEPGPGETAWAAGTAYTVGQLAYRASTHRIYRRLVAGTTATAPESDLTGTAPNWQDYLPTNRWACFDQEVNTQTALASPLTITIDPGLCSSLALIELVGASVTVTMLDSPGGATVYSRTIDLSLSLVADWYAYWFEPFRQRGTLVLTDLPPYLNGRVTVTVTGTSTVKLGGLVLGTAYSLGSTMLGATAGIRDYSRKVTDANSGAVSLEKRRFAKIMKAQLDLPSGAANAVHNMLTELRATPCMWVGDDSSDLEPLLVFGYYKDFSLTVSFPKRSIYSLEIEGMT